MHSFHHSRGRVFFETLCALTVSASCAGAWVQTGASALLPAAAAAALYGLWHLTDMRRPRTAFAVEAVPAEADQGDILGYASTPDPQPAVEVIEVERVEPEPMPAPKPKRAKRTKPEPVEIAEVAMDPEPDEPPVDTCDPAEFDEELHAPIVPLFEAQPTVRQPCPVFGRKAG